MKLTKLIIKASSTDGTREVLNSIYLDATNSMIVATDGRVLVKHPTKFPKDFKNTIIAKETLDQAGRTRPSEPFLLDLEATPPTITGPNGTVEIPESTGSYPNWKVVDPDYKPALRISLSPTLLMNLIQSMGIEKDQGIIIEGDTEVGSQGYRVSSLYNKATGVIMPMRLGNDNKDKHQLGVLTPTPKKSKATKAAKADPPEPPVETPAAAPKAPAEAPKKRKEKKSVPAAEGKPVLSRNEEKNGIELRFDGKPDDATRDQLKAHGFRWGPRIEGQPWYARYSEERLTFANSLAGITQTAESPASKVA